MTRSRSFLEKAPWQVGAVALIVLFAATGCDDPLGEPPPPDVDSAAVYVTNELEEAIAIDFCVRGDGPWLGPVMNQLLGITEGLAAGATDGPFPIAVGTYEARLTDAETAWCFPSATDAELEVTLERGDYDVVIEGALEPMAGEPPVALTVTRRP